MKVNGSPVALLACFSDPTPQITVIANQLAAPPETVTIELLDTNNEILDAASEPMVPFGPVTCTPAAKSLPLDWEKWKK